MENVVITNISSFDFDYMNMIISEYYCCEKLSSYNQYDCVYIRYKDGIMRYSGMENLYIGVFIRDLNMKCIFIDMNDWLVEKGLEYKLSALKMGLL
jgi:hypothetical protein